MGILEQRLRGKAGIYSQCTDRQNARCCGYKTKQNTALTARILPPSTVVFENILQFFQQKPYTDTQKLRER